MKWAMVALNKQTVAYAVDMRKKCADLADIHIYTLPKYQVEHVEAIEGGLKAFNQVLFGEYKVIIYMMAMGIVVRDIAPYLKHKSVDPAVLCLSPDGAYLIPVLSGHLGGANKIATFLSSTIDAKPVITTASDLMHKTAVDLLAKAHHLAIDHYGDAKLLTAMIINDDQVDIISDIPLKGVDITSEITESTQGVIRVTNRTNEKYPIPTATLIPRNIVIGIGAKRHTSYKDINKFLNDCLRKHHVARKAIRRIASIDLKKDETGILELVDQLNVEYVVYTAEELRQVVHGFDQSSFVEKITGVGAVSMPSGYLASDKGTCIAKKMIDNGITISIWEERKVVYD